MTVDIVAEECRRILCEHTGLSVREKSALDKGLESVADSKNETATGNKLLYLGRHLAIVEHIGYKLTASVRLISGGESSGKGKYVTF